MDSKRKKLNKVSPVLRSACAMNIPLDLRLVGEKTQEVYRSRFLGLIIGHEESSVVIEAPLRRGSIMPVRPGSEANISFIRNGRESYFTSTVLARGRFQLNPETSVASLEIRVPEEILSDTKRAFYRVAVSREEPAEIRIGILADDGEGGTNRIRWREKAVMTDIGGGGLGFRIPDGKSLLISPGTRLMLQFRLRPDGEEIKLMGRVCFGLRRPELREAYFGVQFIDIESNIEYKQNVDKVLYFVAEEQRRSLGERA